MSSVHEACLVKWLKYKNISHCELCLTKFIIQEKKGTFLQILKVFFKQHFGSRKQIIQSIVYMFYIFLLTRKYYVVVNYFSKLFYKMFKFFFKKAYMVIKAEV